MCSYADSRTFCIRRSTRPSMYFLNSSGDRWPTFAALLQLGFCTPRSKYDYGAAGAHRFHGRMVKECPICHRRHMLTICSSCLRIFYRSPGSKYPFNTSMPTASGFAPNNISAWSMNDFPGRNYFSDDSLPHFIGTCLMVMSLAKHQEQMALSSP